MERHTILSTYRLAAAGLLVWLAFSMSLAHAESPYTPAGGTLAHWPFNEGKGSLVRDSVRKRAGRLIGGVTWADGKAGKGLTFDGSTGKAFVSTDETLKVGPDEAFVIDVWVKVNPDSLGKSQQIFHGLYSKGQTRLNLEVRSRSGVVWFALGSSVTRNSRINIADGQWHHLAGVRDKTKARIVLYVDGNEDGSAPCDTKMTLAIPLRFIVGGETASLVTGRKEECLAGCIDELRLSSVIGTFTPLPISTTTPPATKKPYVAPPKPQATPPVIPRTPAAPTAKRPPPGPLPPLSAREFKHKQFTNSIGMKFAAISAGDFLMGGKAQDNVPIRKVRITQPFYLGVHEVTQQQFKSVMGYNPSFFNYNSPNHPVDSISYDTAIEFCNKLSAKEKRTYRLPTEAEWEYACRAGTTTAFYFGDDPSELPKYVWGWGKHVRNANRPMPVGTRKPNPWGLYDMSGNVSEWCSDWYDPLYYQTAPAADPKGPERSYLVVGVGARAHRGGNWRGWVATIPRPQFTSGMRDFLAPYAKNRKVGFRIVCEAK